MIKVFVRKTASVLNQLFAALMGHVSWEQCATKALSWSMIHVTIISSANLRAVSQVPWYAHSSLSALNHARKTQSA